MHEFIGAILINHIILDTLYYSLSHNEMCIILLRQLKIFSLPRLLVHCGLGFVKRNKTKPKNVQHFPWCYPTFRARPLRFVRQRCMRCFVNWLNGSAFVTGRSSSCFFPPLFFAWEQTVQPSPLPLGKRRRRRSVARWHTFWSFHYFKHYFLSGFCRSLVYAKVDVRKGRRVRWEMIQLVVLKLYLSVLFGLLCFSSLVIFALQYIMYVCSTSKYH